MKTKLDTLHAERIELENRAAGLKAQQKKMRGQMEADPARHAAALAPKFSVLDTQIEVFTVRLGEVVKQIAAEQKRLNSPEVKQAIKRAGQIVADGEKARGEVIEKLEALIVQIDAALGASHEAADLLRIADRDFIPHSGIYTELSQLRGMLGQWAYARANQQAAIEASRQVIAGKAAQAEAKAKAEADQKAMIEKARQDRQAARKKHNAERRAAWAGILGR